MTNSCSFRITRTAEDLAQTLTALSQRLVNLEQRQDALEQQLQQQPSTEENDMLDGVENLLRECQELLESSSNTTHLDETCLENEDQNIIAA